MSNNREGNSDNELLSITNEARNILEQIKLTAIEVESKRKQTDDSATYAFQAKENAEKHAKSVSDASGEASSALTSLKVTKNSADELAALVSSAKGTLEADLKLISERRRDAETAADEARNIAAQIQGKLQEAEQAKVNAANYQKAALDAQTSAEQASSASVSIRAELVKVQAEATAAATSIADNQKSCVQGSAEITRLLTTSQKEREEIASLLAELSQKDAKAKQYEKTLSNLANDANALKEQIEGLLAGATSVRLAGAFEKQKQRFAKPQKRWLQLFGVCIGSLVLISLPSFINAAFPGLCGGLFGGSSSEWNDLFKGLVLKIPIMAPLVWLAIYAGKNYMLSLRLEEDYGYKEAVSTAFEGYKKEMSNMPPEAYAAEDKKPIAMLCGYVLSALGERPGRIYEKNQTSMSPAEEAKDSIDALKDRVIAEPNQQ